MIDPVQVLFPDELLQGRKVGLAVFYNDEDMTVDYDRLVWESDEHEKPTEEEVAAAYDRALRKAYRLQRQDKYPPIGDQLDALFHAGAFPADMAARIQAVKDQFPKPA